MKTLLIVAFGVLIIGALFGPAIAAWTQENMCLLTVAIILLVVAGVWLAIKYLEMRKKREAELFYQVVKSIEEFEPSKNWSSEEGFQGELQGVLKGKFPRSQVEVQTGASRPDTVIEDIAIEVKGPTDDQAINSLGSKCLKYTQHYHNLIIVLFRCSFSESNYNEILEGMKKLFPNVKVIRK